MTRAENKKVEKKLRKLHREIAVQKGEVEVGRQLRERLSASHQEEIKKAQEHAGELQAALIASRAEAVNYSARLANACGLLLIGFNRFMQGAPEEYKMAVMGALGFDRAENTKMVAYEIDGKNTGYRVTSRVKSIKDTKVVTVDSREQEEGKDKKA